MPFEPDLQVGQEIVNGQLCHIFKCSTQGGMRRSHETGTLVIVSKHIDKKYVTDGLMRKLCITPEWVYREIRVLIQAKIKH